MSQQVYFHSESIHFSGTNICLASGNGISLDCHYVLDAHDSYLDQHFQPYVQGHALAWHLSLPVPYVQGKDKLFLLFVVLKFPFKHFLVY